MAKGVRFSKTALEFGQRITPQLSAILSPHVCDTAGATCHFHVNGKAQTDESKASQDEDVFDNHVSLTADMASMGELPAGISDSGRFSEGSNWVEVTTTTGVEKILACFGLTLADFFGKYPKPAPGCGYEVDLRQVIADLRPELGLL